MGANFSNLFVVACGVIIARNFYDVMHIVKGKSGETPWTLPKLPHLNRIQDISVEIDTQQLQLQIAVNISSDCI